MANGGPRGAETDEELVQLAFAAQERAVAPYSHFRVGAALRSLDGRVFTGCNVEAANYSLTICAERVALVKALSEGVREFLSIAVVSDAQSLTPPCGSCRQLLWEYCGSIPVYLANRSPERLRVELGDLLPMAFGRDHLAGK